MWIGFDDTDSEFGGCTTYIAYELIYKLLSNGFSIIGYPRLIRLNPMVPWKTRGNGAVAIEIGSGSGEQECFGINGEKKYLMNKTSKANKINKKAIIQIIESVIEEYAQFNIENTNPAYLILDNPLTKEIYDKAVNTIVKKEKIISEIEKVNGIYKLYNNGRGIIGASAAISWDSLNENTFELISYRLKDNWGKKRYINIDSVKKMDSSFPLTFNNFDYDNNHNCIVPNSPCPILYGIRSETDLILPDCQKMILSEKNKGWMIFISNQGTDDHLRKKSISNIKPFQSVIVKGSVSKNPIRLDGGHVIFSLTDKDKNSIDCAAYEPTKGFRNIVDQLRINDIIEVYGGVRENPITINIEKINIIKLVEIIEKIENPLCPDCKKHMKSKGKNKGYYCKKCKTYSNQPITKKKERLIKKGFYEVPVCARRHLSKPLKRMNLN